MRFARWLLGCVITETERVRRDCVLAETATGVMALVRRPRRVAEAAVEPAAASMVVRWRRSKSEMKMSVKLHVDSTYVTRRKLR